MNLILELRKSIKEEKFCEYPFVYFVGENAIAKWKPEEFLKNEYAIGKLLLDNGIQVPKIYKLVEPDPISLKKSFNGAMIEEWFFIMQRIKGESIKELSGSSREEAIKQYKCEIAKVLELGINPVNSDFGKNSIFSYEDGKLYLIDFEYWSTNSTLDILNKVYKKIESDKIDFR
jgi:hypothetical protein